MTMTDSDPKNRPGFSHTNWAKIESGHYLKSIETGSPNTGGSTTASIPLKAHTHTGPSHSHGLNSHTHGMTHYHKPYSDNYNFLEMSDSNAISLLQYKVTSGGDNAYVPGYARSSSIESAYIRSTTTSGAIYDGEVRTATSAPLSPNTSTETGGTGNTGSAGESANPSINLDPKYQEVFVWKRVVPGE